MSKPGVSIVICTYNGAPRLPETIRHIARQKVHDHIPWEFIIVNNASRDDTKALAHHEWSKYNCSAPFLIVDEPNPGLSFARSKGFESANYDFIVFCDDDNWLNPLYVRIVYEVMVANKNIGALGGNGKLVYEVYPPAWVQKFSIFAGGPQAAASGPVKRNTLYGAGCVVRKSAYENLKKTGWHSLLTDRLGKELSSGGDYEMCYGLVMAGYEIWYDERLTFKHYIPKDRFTREYYHQYLKESSKCFEVLEPYKIICERKSLKFKNFQIMMFKLLLYYLRRIAIMRVERMFCIRGSVRETMLSLRLYSISMKVSLLMNNIKLVFENYKHGRAFEQKFKKSRDSKSVLVKAVEAMF
jgi:glycosyltransferase involved in cell wall biosynthesis